MRYFTGMKELIAGWGGVFTRRRGPRNFDCSAYSDGQASAPGKCTSVAGWVRFGL